MEVYKDIPGYKGYYKVSNLGNVKSVKRKVKRGDSYLSVNEKVMSPAFDNKKYMQICLYRKNKKRLFKVHQLVAMAFLNHTPNKHEMVVDHIDNNPLNNNVNNLRVTTQRINCSQRHNTTSKYPGVSWDKRTKSWVCKIGVKNKVVFLGRFKKEYDAHLAYKLKLKEINKN